MLVDTFYDRVRRDGRLGPIFDARIGEAWPRHLQRMKHFWSSVLLRTGAYKGKPVPAHKRLQDVRTEDFDLWLSLFRKSVTEVFEAEAQPFVITAAERIAQSLWLAMFADPFSEPPDLSADAAARATRPASS